MLIFEFLQYLSSAENSRLSNFFRGVSNFRSKVEKNQQKDFQSKGGKNFLVENESKIFRRQTLANGSVVSEFRFPGRCRLPQTKIFDEKKSSEENSADEVPKKVPNEFPNEFNGSMDLFTPHKPAPKSDDSVESLEQIQENSQKNFGNRNCGEIFLSSSNLSKNSIPSDRSPLYLFRHTKERLSRKVENFGAQNSTNSNQNSQISFLNRSKVHSEKSQGKSEKSLVQYEKSLIDEKTSSKLLLLQKIKIKHILLQLTKKFC